MGETAIQITERGMPPAQMNSVGRSPSRSPRSPASRAENGIKADIANRKLALTLPCCAAGVAIWRSVIDEMFIVMMPNPAMKYTTVNSTVLSVGGPGTKGMQSQRPQGVPGQQHAPVTEAGDRMPDRGRGHHSADAEASEDESDRVCRHVHLTRGVDQEQGDLQLGEDVEEPGRSGHGAQFGTR